MTDITTATHHLVPDARLNGVLIESMVDQPIAELMVSLRRDPQFGLVLVIGSGGVLAELLHDSITVLMPANDRTVNEAINHLRITRILDGFRGKQAASRRSCLDHVQALVRLMQNRKDILEIEINPMMVGAQQAVCADAVITIIN